MARILVTVGTDGYKDWVKTPDGQKFGLGTRSVLSFVTKLCLNSTIARKTLDAFLKKGEGSFMVDDDQMWALLTPRRARWAAHGGSFMPRYQRHTADLPQRNNSMKTLSKILTATEGVVAYCNKQASAGKPIDPRALQDLGRIASDLRQVNPSGVSAFYDSDMSDDGFVDDGFVDDGFVDDGFADDGFADDGFADDGFADDGAFSEDSFEMSKLAGGKPPADVSFVTPPANKGQTIEVSYSKEADDDGYLYKKVVNRSSRKTVYHRVHAEDVRGKWEPWNQEPKARFKKMASDLIFDIYESNLKVAEDVLVKAKATVATIDKLASAGKRFNHRAAKADVAKVANRVASICEKTALTEEWVAEDLSKLASEASRLHGLFHPAKG